MDSLELHWRIYLGDYSVIETLHPGPEMVSVLYSLFFPPGRLYPIEPIQSVRRRATAGFEYLVDLFSRRPELRDTMDLSLLLRAEAESGFQEFSPFVYRSHAPSTPSYLNHARTDPQAFDHYYPYNSTSNNITPIMTWPVLDCPTCLDVSGGGCENQFADILECVVNNIFWTIRDTVRWFRNKPNMTQRTILAMGYWDLAPWMPACHDLTPGSWTEDHTERFRLMLPVSRNLVSLARTLDSGSFQLAGNGVADRMRLEPEAMSWRYADHPAVWKKALERDMITEICSCTMVTAALHDTLQLVDRALEDRPLHHCQHMPFYLVRPETATALTSYQIPNLYSNPRDVIGFTLVERALVAHRSDLPIGLKRALVRNQWCVRRSDSGWGRRASLTAAERQIEEQMERDIARYGRS